MTPRTRRLRQRSLDESPSISEERALRVTRFYREHDGRYPVPVMRALAYLDLCEHKAIWIGPDELIVGERGPRPKAVPTYPELTCHSLEDLRILDSRPKTAYRVPDSCLRAYEEEVIPYWRGRSMRDRIFAAMSNEWRRAYDAGVFTEFMEQRAPGHTVLDDKIYCRGLADFRGDIRDAMAALDFETDPRAQARHDQLRAMEIACDATIAFAERHAALAREMAAGEGDPERKAELERIAEVCRHVPAHAPRNFHEALQAYWFCHLGVITELNGWDAFSPGHLDQHLLPFYERGLADGSLTPASARELLEAFFVKFNNHPAPPKVGVTAAESGTYTDFANINLAGLLRDGTDGSNGLTHVLLDIVDEMHLLQPSTNLQLSRETPDEVLHHALRVIRKGYGFPSLFNADAVVQEQLRQGKSIEDARAGGCSGCVEVGAFGKEAYILTGYFNLAKVLELALHDGVDSGVPPGRSSNEPGDRSVARAGSTEEGGSAARGRDAARSAAPGGREIAVLQAQRAASRREDEGSETATLGCEERADDSGERSSGGLYRLGPATGQPRSFESSDDLFAAYEAQLRHFIDLKIEGNRIIQELYAREMPAPFLSVLIDDCIAKGVDYNAGGARYNNTFIQAVGIGTVTDCLAALHEVAFGENRLESGLEELVQVLDADFDGHEALRQRLLHRLPKWGNDDDRADRHMKRVFETLFEAIDGRPDGRGGHYRLEMLPTTSHVYFGSVTGATPDGRHAGKPLSEGISPVQGADRKGPTAVLRSAAKMDHLRTGGTLLNMKFTPDLLAGDDGIGTLAHLVRGYFRMHGHHMQFNVVKAETLRAARENPEEYRDLIVRVAGYSDYFCDLGAELQEEIIQRTEFGG